MVHLVVDQLELALRLPRFVANTNVPLDDLNQMMIYAIMFA